MKTKLCNIIVLGSQLIILLLVIIVLILNIKQCTSYNQWLISASAVIMACVAKFETVSKYFHRENFDRKRKQH